MSNEFNYRQRAVTKEYEKNWDRIFNKKVPKSTEIMIEQEYEKIKHDIENWTGGTQREYRLLSIIDSLRAERDEIREAWKPFQSLLEVMEDKERARRHGDIYFAFEDVKAKESDLRKLAALIGKE